MSKRKRREQQTPQKTVQQKASRTSEDLGVSWRQHGIAIFVIVFLVTVTYSNTLKGPFLADDTHNIVENPHVRLTELNGDQLHYVLFGLGKLEPRPVAFLSFALNYYFGEYKVTGYHLVNIAIHLLNGVLVYFLATLTLRRFYHHTNYALTTPDDRTRGWLALFAAALFVAHPLQTQAVTYLVQRMASMMALFYLLSMLFYLLGRLSDRGGARWLYWLGSFASFLLALGTKQNAATLPLAIALYEWYFFQNLDRNWILKRLKYLTLLVVMFGLLAWIYLGDSPWQSMQSGFDQRDFTMGERLLTQFRVVFFYLGLVFFPLPSHLNLLHDMQVSHGLFDPITTLLSILAVGVLLWSAAHWVRKERLLSFGLLWFFLNLAIESSFVPLEMTFEHRVYLPLFGIVLVIPYLLHRLLSQRKTLQLVTAVLLVLSLGYGTYSRNYVWQNELTFWTDVIEKSPAEARAYLARANHYGREGQRDLALVEYDKAVQLRHDYPVTYLDRGDFYSKLGKDRLALLDYSKAIDLLPYFQRAFVSRGRLYARQGKFKLAVEDYDRAIELAPKHATSFNNRAIVHGKMGNFDAAFSDFAEAIEMSPNYVQPYFNRGTLYQRLGKPQAAIDDYDKTLALQPDLSIAYLKRGSLYEQQGNVDQAITDYGKAIEFDEDLLEAYERLVRILATNPEESYRNGEKALGYANRACVLSRWKSPFCLELYAAALAENGEFAEAIEWQTFAIDLTPPTQQSKMQSRLELYQHNSPYRHKVTSDLSSDRQ